MSSIVLGLDTATRATAVGVLAGETSLEAWDDPPAAARPAHASALLPLAARLLGEAGLRFTDVGRIAVGLGPGSFTGLRIGVATARALAQSSGAELTGVSTLRALALPALEQNPGQRVLALVDGGRGEVFAGGWDAERALIAAQPVPRDEVGALIGDAGGEWIAVGAPALDLREDLAADVPLPESQLHRVSGLALCRVEPAVAGRDNVVPDYLRLPDAEISRRAHGSAPKRPT